MAKYTHLDFQTIKKIGELFSIPHIQAYTALEGGCENSSFLIKTENDDFILTIFEKKQFNEIKILVHILEHLNNHQFSTSHLLQTINSKFISSYADKPVIMKRFIDGQIVKKLDIKFMDELGKMIAKLHKIPIPDWIPNTHSYSLDYFPEVLDSNINHYFVSWLQEKLNFLNKNLPKDLPRGFIHSDIFRDNVIQKNGELKAIIDFEEAANNFFAFDLGMAIVGICCNNQKISFKMANVLINGYQKIRKLTQNERNSIKYFTVYAAVSTAFWRFRHSNILYPHTSKARKFQEMIYFADKIQLIDNLEFRKLLNISY